MAGKPEIGSKMLSALRGNAGWVVFALAFAIAISGAFDLAGRYGRRHALSQLAAEARTDIDLKAALLRAVLERPRALPLLLAQDQEVRAALSGSASDAVANLNRKLEDVVGQTRASVLYVIGHNGVAIAASNWRDPLSFVGSNYSFRAYFNKAMKEGAAEEFALGSVSKRAGLYISRRVDGDTQTPGVVVVKMEFDQLEADWRDPSRPTYVTDANGVVLIANVASWHFMTEAPLASDARDLMRKSLQFGNAPLAPLPIASIRQGLDDEDIVSAVLPGGSSTRYLRISTMVPSTPWHLVTLVPSDRVVAAAVRQERLLALTILMPFFGLVAVLYFRRQTVAARIRAQEQARLELERRVDERTADLRQARDHLQTEIAEHRSTEAKLQVVQQELVQVNRLAILGQVAAGVAHEINQPLATIRTYADNAQVFLDRAQGDAARDNMIEISGLTRRIATITDELKAFARKGRMPAEPVDLKAALDGATMLLRSRFAGRLDALRIADIAPSLMVSANQVRLEQVLINLFQNALEAMSMQEDARVDVGVEVDDRHVTIVIADNGPGIAPEILRSLFNPFNTSKEKGLGLGLVISKDILADYGGDLAITSGPSGTTARVTLTRIMSS